MEILITKYTLLNASIVSNRLIIILTKFKIMELISFLYCFLVYVSNYKKIGLFF